MLAGTTRSWLRLQAGVAPRSLPEATSYGRWGRVHFCIWGLLAAAWDVVDAAAASYNLICAIMTSYNSICAATRMNRTSLTPWKVYQFVRWQSRFDGGKHESCCGEVKSRKSLDIGKNARERSEERDNIRVTFRSLLSHSGTHVTAALLFSVLRKREKLTLRIRTKGWNRSDFSEPFQTHIPGSWACHVWFHSQCTRPAKVAPVSNLWTLQNMRLDLMYKDQTI
jgi:hypothetical protein